MPIRNLGLATCSTLAVLTAALVPTGLAAQATDAVAPAAMSTGVLAAAAPTPPKPRPKVRTAAAPTCTKGFTRGTIGGVGKCLAAGQQCLQPHAADYTRYGFTCTTVNGKSRLRSKAAAPKRAAAPHKAARPAAGAAKPSTAPKKKTP